MFKRLLLPTAIALLASASFALGTTYGPRLIGGDGYLDGWTITHDGEDICEAPFIYSGSREIECN